MSLPMEIKSRFCFSLTALLCAMPVVAAEPKSSIRLPASGFDSPDVIFLLLVGALQNPAI